MEFTLSAGRIYVLSIRFCRLTTQLCQIAIMWRVECLSHLPLFIFGDGASSNKEVDKMISEMIAYCGLDSGECKAFKATQTRDNEWKRRIAQHWSGQGNAKFKPEDVDCHGCKSDLISGFCQKLCQIRPCAIEKKVKTCAHCDDYPGEKLKEYLATDPVATINLEKIRKTLRR